MYVGGVSCCKAIMVCKGGREYAIVARNHARICRIGSFITP